MKNRAGFTLLESLVALTLLGILIVTTLAALDRQVRLFSAGATQMDAIQNGRFALNAMEKDLPTAGTNISPRQPFLIYADTHVVAFNADYLSNRQNDVSAIYVDTTQTDAYAMGVMRSNRFTIPRTTVQYPDSNYYSGAGNAFAETIIFYLEPDTITARADDYVMYRQVNANVPDLLARGILRRPGFPFFQYQRKVVPTSGNPYLQLITSGSLPLRHVRPLHGAVDDTGAVAVIDQLKAVTVNFRVTDDRPGSKERVFDITRTIALPNVGIAGKSTCGDEPILGAVGFTATPATVGANSIVRLRWGQATDEAGGEKDVVRYVIYRTTAPGPVGDPLLSIPAGQSSYTYDDATVTPGTSYWYSIAVQDCTPSLSDPVSIPSVTP